MSKNPCTFVRPSSGPGRSSFCPGSRTGAAAGRRIPYPMMYGMKKSDEAIVPLKAANKGAQAPAESPEGRASTKGNSRDQSTHRTQGRDGVLQAVERIRQAATRAVCRQPPKVGAVCVNAHVRGLSRSLLNFGWRTPGLLYEVIYVTPRQQPRRRAEPARPGHRPGAADRGSPGPAGSASPPPPARSPPSVESSGHHASA